MWKSRLTEGNQKMFSMQPKNDTERLRLIAIDVTGWNQKTPNQTKPSSKVGRATSWTIWRVQPNTRANEVDSAGWYGDFPTEKGDFVKKTSILRRQCSLLTDKNLIMGPGQL